MRRRRERELGAYRDGELSRRTRERLERELELDGEGTQRLAELKNLGTVIREAWTEGPPSPASQFVVNALRPELARIDAERRAAGGFWQRLSRRLEPVLRPAPVTALAATAVAALFLVIVSPPTLDGGPVGPVPLQTALASPILTTPSAIYDLDQEESPLLVYEIEGGVTVIWLLEDEQGLTQRVSDEDGWA